MIKDPEKDISIVQSKPQFRNMSFTKLLDSMTISTVIIIFISVAMLYLTNISIDLNMSLKDFGYEAAILYIFTVTINFLSRSVAKRKGRETDAHKKAFDLVENFENEIIEKGLRGKEGEYCRNWEEKELRFTRQTVLSSAGINLKDFESTYLMYSDRELLGKKEELGLTEYQLKIIKKARKIKRLKYDEKYLSTTLKTGRRVSPAGEINTSKFERFRTVQYLITAMLGVCVSASLALDIIANPTFGTVVMCIIKIITILISAIAGMLGGYKLTADMETAELTRKAAEQKNFIKWCEGKTV
ncbi:MAG: hypothetical protein K2K38_02290 [Clostridia bacterium]|nr:hypothetical protein [Clostridia bacterium]